MSYVDAIKSGDPTREKESDYVAEAPFFLVLHMISWILASSLFMVTVGFIAYQVSVLFLPYWLSKLNGDTSYRFPEYMYRVYGDDLTDLTMEHYGYLGSAVLAVGVCGASVIPNHPFENLLFRSPKFKRD